MQPVQLSASSTEAEFAGHVTALAADPDGCQRLLDLLLEDHPVYGERGGSTVSLMRGWVLVALARTPLTDEALRFVLEELDTGVDPYLVAAAARALRSYPRPGPALTPFVMRAIEQIRYHDDPVAFDEYGEFGTPASATSPVRELLETLAWLGPHARDVLPQVDLLARTRGLNKQASAAAARAVEAIRGAAPDDERCCELPPGLAGVSWPWSDRRESRAVESLSFEDHDGATATFNDVFAGHPTIVVFFYTRCDNPLKCSLTVAKLARVQALLAERGADHRIHTAAITYDPAFDSARRIATYGRDRGVRMDERHRMLRATGGMRALGAHFRLGVNFIETLVNRHRVEAYVLDARGRVAASFERLLWDEQAVVDRALEVLSDECGKSTFPHVQISTSPLVAIGVAFIPKCPVCWATYLSMFGIAGLDQVPLPPWLQPLLAIALLVNVASAWFRARSTGRVSGALFVSAGAAAVLASRSLPGWESSAPWGVALVLAGSLIGAMDWRRRARPAAMA